jgi:NDP-sugar pyrophosphorylase family protein
MKAMILAAGVGRRMFPLTLDRAKPVLPVLGRPLALQLLAWLGNQGVGEVVLNLHHRPESLRGVLDGGGRAGLPAVRYSHEEVILGTAGGIRRAAPWLRNGGPIVVCNADFLSDIALRSAVEAHRRSGALATLVLAPPRPGYSIVRTDKRGRVISLAGAPEVSPDRVAGEHLFTGCHVLEEAVLDRIPARGPSDIVGDVYRPLAAEGQLGSWIHEGFWWEFGSPRLYLEGSLRLLGCPQDKLRAISDEHDPLRQLGDAVAAIGPGSEIHDSARFSGRVALGYACHVGEHCLVEDSVVLPEAWVGPGSRLRRCIVGQGAEVPASFEAEDSILCGDPGNTPDLPAGAWRADGLIVYPLDGER